MRRSHSRPAGVRVRAGGGTRGDRGLRLRGPPLAPAVRPLPVRRLRLAQALGPAPGRGGVEQRAAGGGRRPHPRLREGRGEGALRAGGRRRVPARVRRRAGAAAAAAVADGPLLPHGHPGAGPGGEAVRGQRAAVVGRGRQEALPGAAGGRPHPLPRRRLGAAGRHRAGEELPPRRAGRRDAAADQADRSPGMGRVLLQVERREDRGLPARGGRDRGVRGLDAGRGAAPAATTSRRAVSAATATPRPRGTSSACARDR